MKRTYNIGNGCLGILLIVLLIIALIAAGAALWGWLFMVIAGACGWHIPFIPAGWAIGAGIMAIIGAINNS